MSKIKKQPSIELGLDHWQNEVEYFENSLDSLKTVYTLIHSMYEHAKNKRDSFLPSSDEI